MPFSRPRPQSQQAAYNEQWQDAYSATRRVAAAPPSSGPDPVGQIKDLASLHRDGALTDAEFADAKRKVLEQNPAS